MIGDRPRVALRAAVLAVTISWAATAPSADASCDAGGAEAAVRKVFEEYKAALVRGDGATAQRLVDAGTLRYFDDLKTVAQRGTEAEVKARSFVDRLLVVSMRHALDPAVLETLTFEDLIATAMTEGWIQPDTVASLEMGAITVSGSEASGEAIRSGVPAPAAPPEGGAQEPVPEVRYLFACEEGAWKFRFGSLVDQLDRLVSEITRQLGGQEDALIFSLVEAFTGEKVLPDVWQPPAAQTPPP